MSAPIEKLKAELQAVVEQRLRVSESKSARIAQIALEAVEALDTELINEISSRGVTVGGEGFGKAIALKQAGQIHSMMVKLQIALAEWEAWRK